MNERYGGRKSVKYLTQLAVLTATASAIQMLEAPLPRILPWLKPGLSNSIVLYSIIKISPAFGVTVVVLRTIITSIFLGSLFSPVSIISLCGGISSSFVMILAIKLLPNCGLSTISIIGAITNNIAQLLTVQFLFAGNISFWLYLALMIWVSIPSGLIVAKVTYELLRRTENYE